MQEIPPLLAAGPPPLPPVVVAGGSNGGDAADARGGWCGGRLGWVCVLPMPTCLAWISLQLTSCQSTAPRASLNSRQVPFFKSLLTLLLQFSTVFSLDFSSVFLFQRMSRIRPPMQVFFRQCRWNSSRCAFKRDWESFTKDYRIDCRVLLVSCFFAVDFLVLAFCTIICNFVSLPLISVLGLMSV